MNVSKNIIGHFKTIVIIILLLFIIAFIILVLKMGSINTLLLTSDQEAQRLLNQGQNSKAAEKFSDPFRQGIALYRAGEFKTASLMFSRVNTDIGHFNRGNSLCMLGKYEDAVKAFGRSLKLHPKWKPAIENRKIALVRAERIKRKGGNMTDGKLGADDIVFETGKKKPQNGSKTETSGGAEMTDKEIQALWLRKIETKPADFLKSKFAFQLAELDNQKETEDEK